MSELLSPEYLAAERDHDCHYRPDCRLLKLIDHIDAMAAREAKLRALHHEDGGGCCAHCIQPWPDDYQTWGAAKWPCQTMRILDGIK